jgi:hypothetical protein
MSAAPIIKTESPAREYQRGDTPFHASYEQRQITRPCPICFGQKTVRVILGDETIVQTPCDFCGIGFEGSRGYVTDYERTPRVERVTITSVSIVDGEKREVRYSSDHRCLSPEDLFDEEAPALARAEELRIEADEAEAKRSDYGKKSSRQKLSYSIGYHMQEARRDRKSAEYHEGRVVVLKAKEAAKATR